MIKTATIERYPLFGTSKYMVHMVYGGTSITAHQHCQKAETLAAMLKIASREGFTRVRFAGDWRGITVHKTMLVHSGYERHAERILSGEHPAIDFDDLQASQGLDHSFMWTPATLAHYVRNEFEARAA